MRPRTIQVRTSAVLALLAAAGAAHAQTVRYAQGFESVGLDAGVGPANLVAEGWLFRNQSQPLGVGPERWREGPPGFAEWGYYPPQQGDHHLFTTQAASVAVNGQASNWVILPAIPGMQAGDVLEFWFRGFPNPPADRMEVRLSPGGGTSTGSGPSSVGDFTTLLLSEDALTPGGDVMDDRWYFTTVAIPSGGRLAFRYSSPNAAVGGSGGVWAIDDLRVVATPPPEPPYPAPGQTVHWTTSMSPVRIPGDRTIPAGGTVIVDPGVTVDLLEGSELFVRGTLTAIGTAAQPVTFLGVDRQNGVQTRVVAEHGGQITLEHCDSTAWFEPRMGDLAGAFEPGDLTARHCDFHGDSGRIFFLTSATGTPSTLVVEDCTFDGTNNFWHVQCQARVRNVTIHSTFAGNVAPLLQGYVDLDGLTSDGSTVQLESGLQPAYLDHLTVMNAPVRAGLEFEGGQFLLGPNVNVTGCDAPVAMRMGRAGLLPGSHVTPIGNANDIVLGMVFDFVTPDGGWVNTWAPVGVPYVIPGGAYLSTSGVRVLPGARVVLGENATWEHFNIFEAEGTPEVPIVLEGAGFRWERLLARAPYSRFDHCEIRGASRGIEVFGGFTRLSNMLIEDCTIGIFGVDGSVSEMTKSRLINNLGGIDAAITADGGSTPNMIAGNLVYGARTAQGANASLLRGNWWGSPTGPTSPANPGGSGDAVENNVLFAPFLTAAPDFTDTPPTVRILDTDHRVFEPGSKVIMHWSAEDDRSITSQRVLFSPTDHLPGSHVLIATLPPGQRSFEWTVPAISVGNNSVRTFRVEAIDDRGQVGWDQQACSIPVDNSAGTVVITTPIQPVYEIGAGFPMTWTSAGFPPADGPLVTMDIGLVNLDSYQNLGGAPGATRQMSSVSTDFARLHAKATRSGFQSRHFFSAPFAIRPDPRLGDAPPAITVTQPAPGAAFAGGTTIPIRWAASDDVGLRSFDIIASYDGGRWYYPVARNLPANAAAYDWPLPPSTGIADVRVRVIARDARFQDSSSEVALSITPGNGPACDPDYTADGNVDQDDIACLVAVLAGDLTCSAMDPDFNRDGNADQSDLAALVNVVAGGACP